MDLLLSFVEGRFSLEQVVSHCGPLGISMAFHASFQLNSTFQSFSTKVIGSQQGIIVELFS